MNNREWQVEMSTAKKLTSLFAKSLKRRSQQSTECPLHGHPPSTVPVPAVDDLSDTELQRINALLPWKAFTSDSQGRRIGNAAWASKRTEAQAIPDRRIVLMQQRFNLADKHVVEVGCFEGIHTIGLCQHARTVTAVDSRVDNVVKTLVRCGLYGHHPRVLRCDVEQPDLSVLKSDVLHHVGVFYHLRDPVRHLRNISAQIAYGLMLDTHYALDDEATLSYDVDGRRFSYKRYGERGVADPFSGMYDHSKWLTLASIETTLREAGFNNVDVVEKRAERNGPRLLLFAWR
jgi:hypothetical protein